MSDWVVKFSNSRSLPYFYQASTGTSIWEPPAGMTAEQIASLPGASTYLSSNTNGAPKSESSAAPDKVRASHLLIKHAGSRRPSSWKEPRTTRSKEEAIQELERHRQALLQNPSLFPSLAQSESHCSSHSAQGDLGYFSRGQMQKPFEDATFKLRVGEMSGVVDTDSGVHLILRTA